MADGGTAVLEAEAGMGAGNGSRLLSASSAMWVKTALLEAQLVLAEASAARVTREGTLEQSPEYWLGRLEGTLGALVLAVRAELP